MVLELGAIELNYENKTGSMSVMILIVVSMLMLLALLLQICSLVELSARNSPPITYL